LTTLSHILADAAAAMPAAANDADWLAVLGRHKSYIVLFATAAICTLAGTPIYARLATARGWVDRPVGRKAHERPTPTMGGLVIFLTTFAGVAVAMAWGNRVTDMLADHERYVLGAIACTVAAIILGVIDDLRGVRAKIKLLAQFAIAVAAYLIGFGATEITLPVIGSAPLGGLSFAFTVIWIVAIINAVNFTDGMDGLATGVCFLAASVNAGVAIWLENYYMAVMMLLLAGALLGFLKWNFHPARVFLGDAGSLGLGTFLALCSLHSAQKSHTAVMILVPLCALGYPIFDMLLAVGRRTLRGQPMWTSDRDHIHHRLLARGHSPSQATVLIYAASIIVIIACLLAVTSNHLAVGLVIAALLVLAVFCVRVLGYIEWAGGRAREETKILHAAANLARLKIKSARAPRELLAALGVFAAEAGIPRLALTSPPRSDEADAADAEGLTWTAPIATKHAETATRPASGGRTLQIDLPAQHAATTERRMLLDDLLAAFDTRLTELDKPGHDAARPDEDPS
jgi:UDP-GlcNAc:undecaprenyl-phosphate GlcNAc-1-phosphate transferase